MTKHATRPRIADERGATMVVVALSLVFIISMAALSIDLGMLLTARAETQRAADAAALAGAAEYLEATPSADNAKLRAVQFVGKNTVRGNSAAAGVVDVTVDHPNRRVNVRLQQQHDLWFARIFTTAPLPVGAFAAAHVQESGTSPCIKPFGIEDGAYSANDVLTRVLLWEEGGGTGSDRNNVEGHARFVLVGNTASSPGVGNHIFKMITDTDCEFSNVKVGDLVPAKPGNNTRGTVDNGIEALEDTALARGYGTLTWSPNGPYDGFNKPDYADDPRVALVPLYDKSTLPTPFSGTANVRVTGFLRIAILTKLEICQNNNRNHPPCQFPEPGQRLQLYGVILPAIGPSDTCTGAGCSSTTRTLQLIK